MLIRGSVSAWLNGVMGFLQGGVIAQPQPEQPQVARIAGAGAGGAVTGLLVAWIWEAGAAAASAAVSACESAEGRNSVCIPLVPALAAIAGSIVAISAGTVITLWTMQVRPKRVTVPVGCIVTTVAVFWTSSGFPGGRGPAPWAAAIAAGAGLAAVALSARRRRARVAGLAGVVVVLLGSLLVPRTVARQEEVGSQAAKLTQLGFPLQLPSVPGYYPMGGYATPGGSLDVSMGRDGEPSDLALAFTVSITRAGTSDGAFDLGMCRPGQDPRLTPQYYCQAKGPGLWLATERGTTSDVALADNRSMIAVAQPILRQVPDEVLLQAVSSLRPATAAEIAALS